MSHLKDSSKFHWCIFITTQKGKAHNRHAREQWEKTRCWFRADCSGSREVLRFRQYFGTTTAEKCKR